MILHSHKKGTGATWFNRDVVENAEKFNAQFDKIIKKYGDLGSSGENIGALRKAFEDLRNEFVTGEMSMADFEDKLIRTMPKGYDKVGKTMSGMFADLRKYAQEYEWDMNTFMDSYIERTGEIDGMDSTGVGVYVNGVLSAFRYSQQATVPQTYHGKKVWGKETLDKALAFGASTYIDGVWIVIFSTVPYAGYQDKLSGFFSGVMKQNLKYLVLSQFKLSK